MNRFVPSVEEANALVLFDILWRKRFRTVRRTLVPDSTLEMKG